MQQIIPSLKFLAKNVLAWAFVQACGLNSISFASGELHQIQTPGIVINGPLVIVRPPSVVNQITRAAQMDSASSQNMPSSVGTNASNITFNDRTYLINEDMFHNIVTIAQKTQNTELRQELFTFLEQSLRELSTQSDTSFNTNRGLNTNDESNASNRSHTEHEQSLPILFESHQPQSPLAPITICNGLIVTPLPPISADYPPRFTDEYTKDVLDACPPRLRFYADEIKEYSSLRQSSLATNTRSFSDRGLARLALIVGNPGVGKTEAAMAIAKNSQRKLVIVSASAIPNTYKNSGQQQLNKLLRTYANKNYLIVLDEITGLTNRHSNTNDPDASVIDYLLSMIDWLAEKDLFIIATANDVKKIPSALQSRFRNAVFMMGAPSKEARETIIINIFKREGVANISQKLLGALENRRDLTLRDLDAVICDVCRKTFRRVSPTCAPTVSVDDIRQALFSLDESRKPFQLTTWERIKENWPTIMQILSIGFQCVSLGSQFYSAYLQTMGLNHSIAFQRYNLALQQERDVFELLLRRPLAHKYYTIPNENTVRTNTEEHLLFLTLEKLKNLRALEASPLWKEMFSRESIPEKDFNDYAQKISPSINLEANSNTNSYYGKMSLFHAYLNYKDTITTVQNRAIAAERKERLPEPIKPFSFCTLV